MEKRLFWNRKLCTKFMFYTQLILFFEDMSVVQSGLCIYSAYIPHSWTSKCSCIHTCLSVLFSKQLSTSTCLSYILVNAYLCQAFVQCILHTVNSYLTRLYILVFALYICLYFLDYKCNFLVYNLSVLFVNTISCYTITLYYYITTECYYYINITSYISKHM